MRIHFVFIGEGSSDDRLISHLENLCIDAGVDEVTGVAIDFARLPEPSRKTLEAKLRLAIQLEPDANLFFIHRDADSRESESRHREIAKAIELSNLNRPWIAVVPVQEIEAWLLLDEKSIRKVVGKPNGRKELSLPLPNKVENLAQPKEFLQEALITAAEVSGRRLANIRKDFLLHRNLVIERLSTDGSITQVPSWKRLQNDLKKALVLLENLTVKK